MGITTTSLRVDESDLKDAKSIGINISKEVRQLLKNLINRQQNDFEGVSLTILIKQRDKLLKSLSVSNVELSRINNQIDELKKAQEDKMMKQLEDERNRIEESNKCIKCGSKYTGAIKYHNFPKGKVCNGCYTVADAKQIKGWIENG